MSFPPPIGGDEKALQAWMVADSINGIQGELKSINKSVVSIDKRLTVLEARNDPGASGELTKSIASLVNQLKNNKNIPSIVPRTHNVRMDNWIASVDWMKLAKAIVFLIIAIATFAAGFGMSLVK